MTSEGEKISRPCSCGAAVPSVSSTSRVAAAGNSSVAVTIEPAPNDQLFWLGIVAGVQLRASPKEKPTALRQNRSVALTP